MIWRRNLAGAFGRQNADEPVVLHVPTHSLFGAMRVTTRWFPRRVEFALSGAPMLTIADSGLPRFLARRVPPPRVLASDSEGVTLSVDGVSAPIAVGSRAWRRTTYTCAATVNGVHYRLEPVAAKKATCFVNGAAKGDFTAAEANQGPVMAVWCPGVTPQDVAVGTLLASSLGVGAHGMWRNMLRSVSLASP